MGAKIQCSSCYTSYHPLCARIAGLHMEITDGPGPDSAVKLVSFCPKHCQAKPELSGIQVNSPPSKLPVRFRNADGHGMVSACWVTMKLA